MKAMMFYGERDLRYEEHDLGTLETGEVLVRIELALTGGTDVKTYLRGHPKLITSIPSTFGYEFVGTITESKSENFKTGDQVVSANTAPCYQCYFCDKKEFSLCRDLQFLNGSFAEYIKISKRIVTHNLLKVPPGLDLKEAAATQTLAVALHGFERSNIKSGDVVAILGLGAIGQTFIKLCKRFAHNNSEDLTIVALGRSADKLALAKENGADYVLDISDCFKNNVDAGSINQLDPVKLKRLWMSNFASLQQTTNNSDKQELAPYGPDIVIEAVGKPDSWQAALELARPGALVNMFGGCSPGSKIDIDTYKLHYEELRIIGVFHHTPIHIKTALDLLSLGEISMSNLISHEFKLSELEQALELQLSGKAMKIAIRPQE